MEHFTAKVASLGGGRIAVQATELRPQQDDSLISLMRQFETEAEYYAACEAAGIDEVKSVSALKDAFSRGAGFFRTDTAEALGMGIARKP
jgi:hypothetical protein